MIIPAIDLLAGRVVRLRQGNYAASRDYGEEALERLNAYVQEGAKRLHIVDLSGAKDPAARQTHLIGRLVRELPSSVALQTGGGIRTEEDVRALLEAGVQSVVVGSLAVRAPETVRAWLKTFGPERIVLALDVRVDAADVARVAVHGWQETSAYTIEDVIRGFLPVGLKHVLCTDIARDGMLSGPSTGLYQKLATTFPGLCIQASGGIASLADVAAAEAAGATSVIVGRALLENRFTVKEALQCSPNA